MDMSEITALTPMMTPSIVSAERSLFAPNARRAILYAYYCVHDSLPIPPIR